MAEPLVPDDIYPLVSMNRLQWLLGFDRDVLVSLADDVERYYGPFDFRRPGTSKWRHIDAPHGALRSVQAAIQKKLLSRVRYPEKMFGGIKGRSPIENAAEHAGQEVVITLDLKDCFPNTHPRRVFEAWRSAFGCSPRIARLLTILTTFQFRLPQGAPTSPLLANLTLVPLYREIERVAATFGLLFSQFVDDIALSGGRARDALGQVIDAVHANGHAVSRGKTKIMARSGQQWVTGSVTNQSNRLSSGRHRLDSVRKEIYDLAHAELVTGAEVRRIEGLISQARNVCPEQGDRLQRLYDRLVPDALVVDEGVSGKPKGDYRPCDSFAWHRRNASPRGLEEEVQTGEVRSGHPQGVVDGAAVAGLGGAS